MPKFSSAAAAALLIVTVALPVIQGAVLPSSAPMVTSAPYGMWHSSKVYDFVTGGLDLDRNDQPHIGLWIWTAGTKHALIGSYDGTSWSSVDTGVQIGPLAIAFDHSNRLRMAGGTSETPQSPYVGMSLYYAAYNGNGWSFEPVETGGYPSAGTKMVLDAADQPHLLYEKGLSTGNEEVHYAEKIGGTWQITTLEANGGLGTCMAMGPEGTVHLVFDAFTSFPGHLLGIYYMTKSPSGSWTRELIDAQGSVPCIAVGADGIPQVSYTAAGEHLGYAIRLNGSWQRAIIDNRDTGDYNSIQVDSRGIPSIAYDLHFNRGNVGDPTAGRLLYATKVSGKWVNEPAGPIGINGFDDRLRLDSRGVPHIATYQTYGPEGIDVPEVTEGGWAYYTTPALQELVK